MLYCEVLQRGGAKVYRCATRAPRVTRTGTYGPGRASLRHRVTPDLVKHKQDCHGSMMSNVTLKHTVRNRAPLTARSSSLRCLSAAEHQTAEQYSKTGRTKPGKHLPRSDLSSNTRQDFLKIPSLLEASLETERRCFSKVILESNVTQYNKVIRLLQHSSANS